jgi:hypothetical protein
MKKITLNDFPNEYLDYMEELLLVMEPSEITSMIKNIKEKREEEKSQNWNAAIKVEDIGLDWETIIKLKKQNINTLYDVMQLNIETIPGLYSSEVERLEWAVLFFDMTALQKAHKKNPDMSQMDVAKTIVKQSEETNKIMRKKYGERYQGK